METRGTRSSALVGVVLTLTLVVAGCRSAGKPSTTSGSGGVPAKPPDSIKVDGSAAVASLTEAAAELFRKGHSGVQITVGTSGTDDGFAGFCRGETDIADASRRINDVEASACRSAGISYVELPLAYDTLSVVVSKQNTWATCLTVAQLAKIWDAGSTLDDWNQIDPNFPHEPLTLFGADPGSGAFISFTGAITGHEGRSRTDYQATEDDNVTVQAVAATKGGLGYLGFTFFEENADTLNVVQIDDGRGCVGPSVSSAQDGSYIPLARALFLYVNAASLAKPAVAGFAELYLANAADLAEQGGFVLLTHGQLTTSQQQLTAHRPNARVPATPTS